MQVVGIFLEKKIVGTKPNDLLERNRTKIVGTKKMWMSKYQA